MEWTKLNLILCLVSSAALAVNSPYVYIFQSAKARAVEGLTRQKARRVLASREYLRAKKLFYANAMSSEEFEHYQTADILSKYDLEIAELRTKEADIELSQAEALAKTGQPVPLCRRKKQIDENTVSPILDKAKTYYKPPNPLQGLLDYESGTQLDIVKAQTQPDIPDQGPPQDTTKPNTPDNNPPPSEPKNPSNPDGPDVPDVPTKPVKPVKPPPTKPPPKKP